MSIESPIVNESEKLSGLSLTEEQVNEMGLSAAIEFMANEAASMEEAVSLPKTELQGFLERNLPRVAEWLSKDDSIKSGFNQAAQKIRKDIKILEQRSAAQ